MPTTTDSTTAPGKVRRGAITTEEAAVFMTLRAEERRSTGIEDVPHSGQVPQLAASGEIIREATTAQEKDRHSPAEAEESLAAR